MTTVSTESIKNYWDEHIHDLAIATFPVGTNGFFQELEAYRFDKLRYLNKLLTSKNFKGKKILEIGCGIGIDLVLLAKNGAITTGIDLSPVAINLAIKNFTCNNLKANLSVMDGEQTAFPEQTFDFIYAHGVLQYTADDLKMVKEIHRLLKHEGQAMIMFYNRLSWLNTMSKLTRVDLEHEDAPVLRKYTASEVKRLLACFQDIKIQPERFPVESRLHKGIKAQLYNRVFVKTFNLLPKFLVRPLGWHLLVTATKA